MYKNRHKPAVCPKCGYLLSQKDTKIEKVKLPRVIFSLPWFNVFSLCIKLLAFHIFQIISDIFNDHFLDLISVSWSIQAPQSRSEGPPTSVHFTTFTAFPAFCWKWNRASGNAESHPRAQQSADHFGPPKWPGTRGQRGDRDNVWVWLASVLWISCYSLQPVQLPSVQRRSDVSVFPLIRGSPCV